MEIIVVGVDGSASADEALRFAAREAKLRDARLRLVTVWHVPTAAYSGMGVPVFDSADEMEADANQVLDQATERLAADLAGADIERVVREGRAATRLVDESHDAELLVVGSRGHGGFVGLLMGSVSNECAQHAPCPVVVVRAKKT